MIIFTGLDYAYRLQDALDRTDDEFATGLPLEARQALADALGTHITRSMTEDRITGAGIRYAMALKQTYFSRWAFAYDHEEQRYRWIDTTGLHAGIALKGCTMLIPHNA